MLKLAIKSLFNRKVTTFLTVLSLALSVSLYLLVDKIKTGAENSFTNTISQTDLIVGAKTGSIQLLLYSVFHLGSLNDNISFKSFTEIKNNPQVDWVIPISLGDSYQGYRVVATNEDYFLHYRFHGDHEIEFSSGEKFKKVNHVVLGAEVAKKLGHKVGDKIVLTHGVSEGVDSLLHSDFPFEVSGILKPTFTPLDRSVYITLTGMEAIHIDWQSTEHGLTPTNVTEKDLPVEQITAFFLRAKSRIQTLWLQRFINNFENEALVAIIPGVTLSEFWSALAYFETTLRAVSLLVILVGLFSMIVALYTSLNERRREMAILRSLGATPFKIFTLLICESLFLGIGGVMAGLFVTQLSLLLVIPYLESEFGIHLKLISFQLSDLGLFLVPILLSGLVGIIPAFKAYRNSLSDGLSIKL